ncbi:MAG: hypothetical protein JWR80_7566 [Bradyrhizobium sp.]|nr:hypothetical protein [Bradyrhizobium sp.]
MKIAARALTPGTLSGRIALLTAPLSLWGGLDLATGRICDVNHPQHGRALGGEILAMTAARGSSSSSSALAEAVRRGTAPAAIIMASVDPILVIGSLVAADLYDIATPILIVAIEDWPLLNDEQLVMITGDGERAELQF